MKTKQSILNETSQKAYFVVSRHPVLFCCVLIIIIMIGSQSFATKGKKDKEIYNYYQLFADVYDKIVHYYVDETNPQILIEGAIRGMIDILDRNNYYLSADELISGIVDDVQHNQYGLILGVKNKKLLVISAVPDSPASEVGVTSGDWIWSIGETLIGTLPSLMENYKLLIVDDDLQKSVNSAILQSDDVLPEQQGVTVRSDQGTEGEDSDVKPLIAELGITFLRGEEKSEIYKHESMSIKQAISFPENETATHGQISHCVYIHPQSVSTLVEFEQLLQHSGLSNSPAEKLLILDLRQVYSLSCQTAIDIARLFMLSNQLITSLHYYNNQQPEPLIAQSDGPYSGMRLAVLVDRGTAGGAEILAAALSLRPGYQSFGQPSFGYAFKRDQVATSDGGIIYLIAGVYHTSEGKPLFPDVFTPSVSIDEALAPSEWQKLSPNDRFSKDPVIARAVKILQGTLSASCNE